MDETTKRALLAEIDAGIDRAAAEIDKLEEFKAWVIGVGNGSGPVATIGVPQQRRIRKRAVAKKFDTRRYIKKGFANADAAAALTFPEVMANTLDAGWKTTSAQPETIIRTTLNRMVRSGEAQIVRGPGARRWRLVDPDARG